MRREHTACMHVGFHFKSLQTAQKHASTPTIKTITRCPWRMYKDPQPRSHTVVYAWQAMPTIGRRPRLWPWRPRGVMATDQAVPAPPASPPALIRRPPRTAPPPSCSRQTASQSGARPTACRGTATATAPLASLLAKVFTLGDKYCI
jgi:hypothetical protein